jgi:hypothetical protein
VERGLRAVRSAGLAEDVADVRRSFGVVGPPPSLHNDVMTRIDETRLPGIGLRHDFVTAAGARIGVVTYRDGRRELVVYAESDPDECCASVPLDEEDAHVLADLLGGSQIIEHLERERERPPT